MGEVIDLGRIPQSPEERRELIERKIAECDEISGMALPFIQKGLAQFLVESRGYALGDLLFDRQHPMTLADGTSFEATADMLAVIEGRSLMMIKCTSSSLESWERYCTAFCRVVEPYLIPLAIVTDGISARMIDTLSGQLVAEDPASIPSRDAAISLIVKACAVPLTPQAMERERRILYAFDAIRCPAAKGEASS